MDFAGFTNRNRRFIPALILVVLLAFGLVVYVSPQVKEYILDGSVRKALSACEQFGSGDEIIDCWYELIRQDFQGGGIQRAFATFDTLYENSDMFIITGCHRHAHRIGDAAYYESYLTHKDLQKMEFPPITKVCGYGFYHGFIEHLIQDNPDPHFVKETCDYLDGRLSLTAPDIRITCFHGSGHGYTLASVDTDDTSSWGDAQAFVEEPLKKCEMLDGIEREVEECKEGVFNVIVEWMVNQEFGLEYDEIDPFTLCREQEHANQQACYYEMAQKLDSVAEWDVTKAAHIAEQVPNKRFAQMVLSVAVASMMQTKITEDGQYTYLQSCRNIPEYLRNVCLVAIVGGAYGAR